MRGHDDSVDHCRGPTAASDHPEEVSQVLHGKLGGRDLQEVREVVEVVQRGRAGGGVRGLGLDDERLLLLLGRLDLGRGGPGGHGAAAAADGQLIAVVLVHGPVCD